MSNRSTRTKKSTTTTTTAKRTPGRPKKIATTTPPKRVAKARIVTVTDRAQKAPVPASVKKLAEAKAKQPVPKTTKQPAVNPHLLNEAYAEATAAAKKYEEQYTKLRVEVASVKAELERTNRTVAKLKDLIEEIQTPAPVKRSVWPWGNR